MREKRHRPNSPVASAVPDGYVCLARIAKSFGVKGGMWLCSYTAKPEAIFNYSPLYLYRDLSQKGENQQFEPVIIRRHSQSRKDNRFIAFMEHVTSCEQAEELNGVPLLMQKKDLPPCEDDEFYFHDLVGLKAVSIDGMERGRVMACYETGAGAAILAIKSTEGVTKDIPFTKMAIEEVDIAQHCLTLAKEWDDFE